MPPDPHQLFLDTLQRYERPLIRYAQNIVGQLDDARDIVQDVFVKLSQTLHSLDTERLAPWLFTVCKNRATDHLRKHSRITLMGNRNTRSSRSRRVTTRLRNGTPGDGSHTA